MKKSKIKKEILKDFDDYLKEYYSQSMGLGLLRAILGKRIKCKDQMFDRLRRMIKSQSEHVKKCKEIVTKKT